MTEPTGYFRCVCGEQILLMGSPEEAICPRCNRTHPATAFAVADAATITVDSDDPVTPVGEHLEHALALPAD